MMQIIKKIIPVLIFILMNKNLSAQTAGINYQALISNTEEIQIPGADVEVNQVVLAFEDVSFRFTILDESFQDLYIEEQTTITDKNGMVSVIVGDGIPLFSTFESIVWDGILKYLNVEIDIHSQNQGYVVLDIQKILYLPQSGNGATIDISNALTDISLDNNREGDLVWVQDADSQGNPSLMIWNGTNWIPVTDDFDPTNELDLIVAADATVRDSLFPFPLAGNQVWNQSCSCIEVFNGTSWVSSAIGASNGLHKNANTIKLGGSLIEPTEINTDANNTLAINGLQEVEPTMNNNVLTIDTNSGVITRSPLGALFQEEVTLTIAATDGQNQFATPLPIVTPNKVNIFRNGVRIGFTVINNTIVELEPEATCYAGDEIRIVQFIN
jgi:hypothetical protein